MSKQCTKPKRKRDDSWFKDKVLLVQAQANGQILHEEELAFLVDPGIAEVSLMANLSHYGSDALAEVHNPDNMDNNMINQAQTIHMLTKPKFFYDHTTKQAMGFQNPNYLKKAQQLEPKLYDDNVIKNAWVIVIPDSEEILMLAEESHFEKQLVSHTKLSAEQAFWSQNSMNSSNPNLSKRPTKVEVPKELSKVSMLSYKQEKETVISKLKKRIKSLSGNVNEDKVKKDIEEIETINIELDHRMSKLISENEHLKQTYKQLYDLIKPTRIRSKEQSDALIKQVNLKSVEIYDLNVSLQEKDLVISALRDEVRKLKGKAIVDNAITTHTIDPEMLKVDVEPIAPRLLNNRTVHSLGSSGARKVVQIVLWYLDSGYSKNMTKDRSQLTNFINKFLGTVKFGNDHVATIIGYGDYQIGNVMISRVYYVEGLGHNLFSVGQFCDSNLEVAFRQHTCFIRNLEVTWVKCLRSKDEAPDFIIKFLKMISVRLKTPVCRIRTDNETEFVNHTLREYYEKDLLFLLLFDELLTPPPSVDLPAPKVIAPIAEVVAPKPDASTGSPSLTTVDQDAPSPSNSQTTPETQSPVISNDVKEENHDLDVAHMNNDSFFGVKESPKTPTFHDDPLHESLHEDSTSQGSSSNMRQTHTPFESLGRWTKDHPIANMIGDSSRSVSTRKQLQTDAMWCFFDAS
nr:integrase, catalytic region, zinc finger, CCHC-type, peptidase aspartic, catalytic [Tanacetum cinerariifolium]